MSGDGEAAGVGAAVGACAVWAAASRAPETTSEARRTTMRRDEAWLMLASSISERILAPSAPTEYPCRRRPHVISNVDRRRLCRPLDDAGRPGPSPRPAADRCAGC